MSLLVSQSRRRRALFGAASVVAAAGFFASGVLVANASHGDSPTPRHVQQTYPAGESNKGGDIAIGMPPVTGRAQAGGGTASSPGMAPGAATTMPASGGCSAPLPGMLNGDSVDLTAGGLAPKFAGGGFVLESVTLRGDVPCGQPDAKPAPYLETRYRHTETGFEVTLSQRHAEKPGPNIIRQGWGQAYADGHAFTANVMGNPMIMDGGFGGDTPATDIGQPADVPPAKPAIWPGPANDPRMAALVEQVLSHVAPSVEGKCYYRQVAGSWDDLASVGLGDPRPALPAGFVASNGSLYFIHLTQPAPECNAPALDTTEPTVSMNATLSNGQAFLNISVNSRMGQDGAQPGQADDGYISWQSDKFWFSVSGQSGAGSAVSRDALTAIAKALDPSFGSTCIVSSRMLEESALAGLGFHAPATPEGYRQDSSQFAAIEGNGACGSSRSTGYALSWMFFSQAKGSVIEAGVTKNLPEGDPRAYYYASEGSLVWKDGSGAMYHVSALKMAAPRETLLTVARSMDPNFDESKLLAPGDLPGGPKTLPAPAPGGAFRGG